MTDEKKTFILNARCSFQAENVEDALVRLALHFLRVALDENYTEDFLETGEIRVSVVEK